MVKIFVASAGRCGTKYLAGIFDALTDIPSFHEPQPYIINDVLEALNNNDNLQPHEASVIKEKLDLIELHSKSGNYFESNQQFIKAYVRHVLGRFNDVSCIYLYRNPLDSLISYAEKCRHFESDWFLKPEWRHNILRCQPGLSFYEMVLWQWYEVRARYYRWKPYFRKTYELDFKNLSNPDEIKRMFRTLGVDYSPFGELPEVDTNAVVALALRPLEGMVRRIQRNWGKPGTWLWTWDAKER